MSPFEEGELYLPGVYGDRTMKVRYTFASSIGFILLTPVVYAEDVLLPIPVLRWSFYIFLAFALVVAIGIFFVRNKKGVVDEQLGELIEDPDMTVHSVTPEMSVTSCVRQMIEYKIGAMLVMEDDRIVGIFTERDCLTKVVGAGLDPEATKVSMVMTKDPYCVTPGTSIDEAMSIITSHRFRHLPVIDDGRVLGIISSGDLTHRIVEDRSIEIRDLVNVAGRRRASL
jgi:predicted transcriptional regulator